VEGGFLRSFKAIIKQPLHSPEVEVVEITIQYCIPVLFFEAFVLLGLEMVPEEVSDVAENNQDHVADVGRQSVEVGRFIHDLLWEGTTLVLRNVAMSLRPNGSEL
jgi:hypothetical protein